jgi:acyl-CoA thioesterase II
MGDLANDTEVRPRGHGSYEATLSADWEIWGPMGGYVAACALRAAGASTEQARPAAFSCHYLGVARFGAVDLRVWSPGGQLHASGGGQCLYRRLPQLAG